MQWWCAAQDVAWSWTWRPYPGVWIFIATLALGFAALHRRWRDNDGVLAPRTRRWTAAIGLLLLWIALDWPVGALGSAYLASVHMVQFLLIAVSAPPLLLLGIPRPALERWVARPLVRPVVRVLGHPIVSLLVFAVLMGFTHWPPAADAMMADQAGSFVLDMLWLFSGLVFWWPVAVALPERSWLREPFKMGYLITSTLINIGVFAYLTFSAVPIYSTFELAPPVGSLSSRDDQLLAGLLMKAGGAVVLWTTISILFYRWYRRSMSDETSVPRRGAVASGLLLLLLAGACGPAAPPRTTVEGSVLVGEPVTGEMAALYLALRGGVGGDHLDSVTVEGVRLTSLHRTDQVDGMMQMREVEGGFEIPEGGRLELRPGGDHVMLEDLERSFAAGDSVAVTIHLRSGAIAEWARVVALADLERAFDGDGS